MGLNGTFGKVRAGHRDDAPPLDCRTGQNAPAMSMLFSADDKASAAEKFLMQ
jgi:hypothetical protein